MNVVILNGNPRKTDYAFDRYLEFYRVKLHKTGHYVRSFLLRDMRINDIASNDNSEASGNKDCEDDFRYIINSLADTDLLVIASPLEHNFITPLAKMALSRLALFMVPPENMPASIFRKSQNMSKMPVMGFIMQKEPSTAEQDLLLNRLTVDRMAANLHTVLNFCVTTDSDVSETFHRTIKSVDYQYYIEQTYNGLITGSTIRS